MLLNDIREIHMDVYPSKAIYHNNLKPVSFIYVSNVIYVTV